MTPAKHECLAGAEKIQPAIVTHNDPKAMRNDKSVLPTTLPLSNWRKKLHNSWKLHKKWSVCVRHGWSLCYCSLDLHTGYMITMCMSLSEIRMEFRFFSQMINFKESLKIFPIG